MFDERALFYGCSAYAGQLNEQQMKGEDWYCNLKPVIALQFLDFDSQRVRGIEGNVADSLLARFQANPMASDQYKKHYMFVDQCSGQSIQDLQLVQVELRRSKKDLFPPKSSFSISDWWLSVFRFSSSYNETVLDECKGFMPSQILRALTRLRLDTWNDEQQAEYIAELRDRDTDETVLAVERAEDVAQGVAQGVAEGKAKSAKILISKGIARQEAIELLELTSEEVGVMDSLP